MPTSRRFPFLSSALLLVACCASEPESSPHLDGTKASDLLAGCVSLNDNPAFCERDGHLRRRIEGVRGLYDIIPPQPTRRLRQRATYGQVRWDLYEFPEGTYMTGVCMANDRVGFAVGSQYFSQVGVIYRTTDGGDTWTTVATSTELHWPYGCVAVADTGTVAVVGFNAGRESSGGLAMFSSDSGETWGAAENLVAADGTRPWLDRVEFADDFHGLITSFQETLFRTETGGGKATEWDVLTLPVASWWQSFTFLPDGRAWLAGVGQVHSSDFGKSWSPRPSANPTFDGPIAIDASGFGFVGGGMIYPRVEGWVHRTFDAGGSWSSVPVFSPTVPVRDIKLIDSNRAAVSGGVANKIGAIWTTANGGDAWMLEVQTTDEIRDMDVVDSQTGPLLFAIGGRELWRRDFAP